MARCVSCGVELHPERAEKYDYCMDPACRAKHAHALTIASIGVNKAADQFVVLDERTEEEMAAGRYRDARRDPSIAAARPRRGAETRPAASPPDAPGRRREQPAESWTQSQQNLALALHITGRKSLEEISARIGLRSDTVARMIVAAKRRWRR